MNERVTQVRKELKLNQEDFAKKLNLSRNFINQVECGKKNMSDRTILEICREFHVNEQWLRTGEGEMFDEEGDDLEAFFDSANATELERRAIRAYFSIPSWMREPTLNYFIENLAGDKIREKGRSEQKTWPEEDRASLPPEWTDDQVEMWMAGYEYAQKKNKAKKEAEDEAPEERSYPSLDAS